MYGLSIAIMMATRTKLIKKPPTVGSKNAVGDAKVKKLLT